MKYLSKQSYNNIIKFKNKEINQIKEHQLNEINV
jgi:hypothetical protein